MLTMPNDNQRKKGLQNIKNSVDNRLMFCNSLISEYKGLRAMTTKRLLTTALALVAISSGLLFKLPTAKAEVISISPPQFQLFGNPGDIINETMRVRNDGTNTATYQTSIEDFTASGDQGGIDLVEDPNAPKKSYSLAKWMTIEPSRFTVPANSEKVLNVMIRIPKNGEPGGHYASVQIKLSGGNLSGSGASVESRLNSLVLLRVSGDIKEKLDLNEFKTDSNYYQTGPINFALKTTNKGNVHSAATGLIVITDTFGHKVKELPLKVGNVLPESSRSITTTWDTKSLFGFYTATLVATYGQNKIPLTSTTKFTVIPITAVVIILVLLVVIFLSITQRKKIKQILHNLTSD